MIQDQETYCLDPSCQNLLGVTTVIGVGIEPGREIVKVANIITRIAKNLKNMLQKFIIIALVVCERL
jgi:hypothetical protein